MTVRQLPWTNQDILTHILTKHIHGSDASALYYDDIKAQCWNHDSHFHPILTACTYQSSTSLPLTA